MTHILWDPERISCLPDVSYPSRYPYVTEIEQSKQPEHFCKRGVKANCLLCKFVLLSLRQFIPLPLSQFIILERFQSKALRMITNAPWFVPNAVILRDLQTPAIKEEIRRFISQYGARLSCEHYGSTRRKQANTKTFSTRSAYQILSVYCNYRF
jgi:hypothetical protein